MNEEHDTLPHTYAFLIIENKVFPLNRIMTTLGRKHDNDIVVPDRRVSRYHSRIIYQDENYHLLSTDKRNGTRYKDTHLYHKKLKAGDAIHLGHMQALYMENQKARVEEPTKSTGELVKPIPRRSRHSIEHSPTIPISDLNIEEIKRRFEKKD